MELTPVLEVTLANALALTLALVDGDAVVLEIGRDRGGGVGASFAWDFKETNKHSEKDTMVDEKEKEKERERERRGGRKRERKREREREREEES